MPPTDIATALRGAPIRPLTDAEVATLTYELAEAIDATQSRWTRLEADARASDRMAALLVAHFGERDWAAVDILGTTHGTTLGWIDWAETTIGFTPDAETHAATTIANISAAAKERGQEGMPLLSIPTEGQPADTTELDPEAWSVMVIDGDHVAFPVTAALSSAWTCLGSRPSWLKAATNPDLPQTPEGK